MRSFKKMRRRRAREQAFMFVFENRFGSSDVEEASEIIESLRDEEISEFALEIFSGVKENRAEIERHIEENSKTWKKERLSNVVLAVLKIAIYEILKVDSIPVNVSINEAVELAKKYGEKDASSYVNGVLGNFFKNLQKNKEPAD
jgi:N utilization substance protein B